jgi:hypothetical protein
MSLGLCHFESVEKRRVPIVLKVKGLAPFIVKPRVISQDHMRGKGPSKRELTPILQNFKRKSTKGKRTRVFQRTA